MSKKAKGLVPAALRGQKAMHAPPMPNPFPPPPTHTPKPSGLRLRQGRGIPGHNTGGGQMTGC